jgi:stearoyl-CoA desaturase (Delta-9 desaturase)
MTNRRVMIPGPAAPYDVTVPFTVSGRPPGTVQGWARVSVTTAFVVPFAGPAAAAWLAWGHGLNLADVLLALTFYVITGLGVTMGFHRLLTHRSPGAARRAGDRGVDELRG